MEGSTSPTRIPNLSRMKQEGINAHRPKENEKAKLRKLTRKRFLLAPGEGDRQLARIVKHPFQKRRKEGKNKGKMNQQAKIPSNKKAGKKRPSCS